MTASAPESVHVPVLLEEVAAALSPVDGGTYVDGTFGAGGYSKRLLDSAQCRVFAIDRDPDAIDRARPLVAASGERLVVIEGRFGDMDTLVPANGAGPVDGIALDLGVSSPQLDAAERGFSFREDGPLDMRMEKAGPSAADIVNGESEKGLADIIFQLGEERHARRIARAIVAARTDGAILRTRVLAELVRGVVPAANAKDGIHPATRTFQALRIHVNRELEELDRGLRAAERLLAPGGRLAVVSFHSLEDRRVKTFLRRRAGDVPGPSRHQPVVTQPPEPSFKLVGRRPVAPGEAEVKANPRARSAKLRVAERTHAPAWTEEESLT